MGGRDFVLLPRLLADVQATDGRTAQVAGVVTAGRRSPFLPKYLLHVCRDLIETIFTAV